MPRPWLILLVVAVVAVAVRPARACVSCSCGSTAALPPGNEVPFAGRLRTGLIVSSTSATTTDELGDSELRAFGMTLVVAGVVLPGLVLDGSLPVGGRLRLHDGERDGFGLGVGDIGGGARFVWTDRGFRPSLVGSLRLGLRLPTTTTLRDAKGPLSPELQPGAADLAADLQLSAAWLPNPVWSFIAAGGANAPVASLDEPVDGAGVDGRLLALWRVDARASVRGGVLVRGYGPAAAGHPELNLTRLTFAPEVGVSVELTPDVVLAAVVAVPLLGSHATIRDGASADVSVFVDW